MGRGVRLVGGEVEAQLGDVGLVELELRPLLLLLRLHQTININFKIYHSIREHAQSWVGRAQLGVNLAG